MHTVRQWVYFITISRVIHADNAQSLEDISREDVATAVRAAFDNPVDGGPRGGRPRAGPRGTESRVQVLVVFREKHADGAVHYHVAVKLCTQMRFAAAKRTLWERFRLPSHFSCSHTQLWSAVRYGYMPSATKPVVDDAPHVWTYDGRVLDLFAISQEPYEAEMWRKRRENVEKAEAKAEKGKRKGPAVTKLDLTSLILSKNLATKDAVLAYVQKHGSAAMQAFVHKVQRHLPEYILEAKDWAAADENATFEQTTDWALLCAKAESPCQHGCAECSYRVAARDIFAKNADTLSQTALAAALRAVMITGPTKTTRVPFLVGPSNSGKSTLLYPFDDLFGPTKILHKPALGSSFGLRNITKKRFIFWDDYRPVEFAHEKTVPASLFLSLFIGQHAEIQVSQAFQDGNLDVKWDRGAAFTAKLEGLWASTRKVGEEDVRHMRNRVLEFHFLHTLPPASLRVVTPCAPCMAAWIREGAARYDAAGALSSPVLPVAGGAEDRAQIEGFGGFVDAARLPVQVTEALRAELLDLGVVDITEVAPSDWRALPSWSDLRPFEQRRVLRATESRQRAV